MGKNPSQRTFGASADFSGVQSGRAVTVPGEEPKGSPEPSEKKIRVRLVNAGDQEICDFWVGLCSRGANSPGELLKFECIMELLSEAARAGLDSQEPVMISDVAAKAGPRFVYLTPPPGSRDQTAEWVCGLSHTLKAWNPKKVGFWFSPELTGKEEPHALLKNILLRNILDTDCTDYYLLKREGAANSLLNAALSLRPAIADRGHSLSVFH